MANGFSVGGRTHKSSSHQGTGYTISHQIYYVTFPQPIEPMKTFKNGSKLFEIMFADRKILMMDDDHSRKSL